MQDVILHIIRNLGVNGGTGFAYEYAGSVFDNFSMEERMTACNMSIEGGARVGYVNPDKKHSSTSRAGLIHLMEMSGKRCSKMDINSI